jgi:ParB-like chromosome segregation protein Spo0J
MSVQLINISELTVNPNNPRIIKDEKFDKLVQSIKEFPDMLKYRPIVVDENNVILGGNMRFKACKAAKLKQVPVMKASELTEAQKREFIIKDNVSGGEWDWAMLQNEWDTEQLDAWGVDSIGFDLYSENLTEDFSLPDGDKAPFQQMTFTLADEQAAQIQNAIADIKLTNEYKYCETFGNENSNGNALYLIVMQWVGQKK